MKKVISLTLALLMAFSCAVGAFAVDNFIGSPEAKGTPILVSFKSDSIECTAKLVVTPYRDRATLPQDKLLLIEDCYRQIVGASSLTALMPPLVSVAQAAGLAAKDLFVSDLFDVSYYSCSINVHQYHGGFTITIKADSLDRFVALMHYKDSNWQLVTQTEVSKDKTELTFYVKELSPFAIVVHAENGQGGGKSGASGSKSGAEPTSPQTSDAGIVFLWAGAAFAVGAVLFLLRARRKNAFEK